MRPQQDQVWLLLPLDAVPAEWRPRAVQMSLVPLLPNEARSVLAGESAVPALDPADLRLVELVARGLSGRAISREIRVPLRTVERHLSRLRSRFGVATTAELAAVLARRGFGGGNMP